MGRPLHWIVILQLSCTFAYRYDSWYRADTQRPVDVVTDVVNDLGVKILQQYAAHGNVAFSPTGVAFVLAALYEGSAGRGSQQIAEAAGLPANRDVTRIGFRDIHRRLRSYLNADGFLGGLTLSRENTRLRPEYEDILRFYGFDLSSIEQEANVTVSAEGTPGTTELPTSTLGLTTLPMGTIDVESAIGAITTLPAAGTTIVPSDVGVTQQTVAIPTAPSGAQSTLMSAMGAGPGSVVTGSQVPQQPPGSLTTVTIGESAQPTPITTATGPAATPTDGQTSPSTVTAVVVAGDQNTLSPTAGPVGGTAQPNVPAAIPNATGPAPTTAPTMGAGTAVAPATLGASTDVPTTVMTTNVTTVAIATMPADVFADNATSNVATENAAPAPPMGTAGGTTTPSAETAMDNSIVGGMGSAATTIDDLTTVPVGGAAPTTPSVQAANGTSDAGNPNNTALTDNQAAGSLVDENSVSTNRRRRRSTESEAASRAGLDLPADNTVKDESTNNRAMNRRRRRARSPRGYFSSYPDEGIWMQDLDIWKSYSTVSPSESSVGDDTSEISFLVNGCDVSSVSASTYIAVLPFAYFPSLHAVALEFPLDDPRYNIILLMPTDRTDTHRLARDLSGKSLRSLRKRLQPTWVRATIPSFMLRGFVTLTSFLQRLGILDVFEPRVADLSPMTADLGVYARDVQQSIGVNIRNYMKPDRTHSRNGLFERAGPVPFTALHPFLYFIVDTETSVSLIAGRVDDPLNSRIL